MDNKPQITFTWYDENGDSKFRIQENINGKFWPSYNVTLTQQEVNWLPRSEIVELLDEQINKPTFTPSTDEMETSYSKPNKFIEKIRQLFAKYSYWIMWAVVLAATILPIAINGADDTAKKQQEMLRLRQERELKYTECQNQCMQEREVYDAQVNVIKKQLQAK